MTFTYKRRPLTPWTAQEIEVAARLVADNASEQICQATLGRTRQACRDKLRRSQKFVSPPKMQVPDHVLDDRNRRLMAGKSLTGWLMGDPEPNRARL